MTAFLDSSALVKRYVKEEGEDLVRAVGHPIVASALATVEVPAALWRKRRMGDLSSEDARFLSRRFRRDITVGRGGAIELVDIGSDLLSLAVGLVARHPLRANDAVQLATALRVDEALGGCRFACFDRTLLDAAAAEGLESAWP